MSQKSNFQDIQIETLVIYHFWDSNPYCFLGEPQELAIEGNVTGIEIHILNGHLRHHLRNRRIMPQSFFLFPMLPACIKLETKLESKANCMKNR